MSKTKLGISVGMLAAITYFCGLFAGLLTTVVVAGYILIAEEDMWLRKVAVRAVALLIVFQLVYFVIGIIPDVFGLIDSVITVFDSETAYDFSSSDFIRAVENALSVISSVIGFVQGLLFAFLGITAFVQKNVKLPVIDDIIDREMK